MQLCKVRVVTGEHIHCNCQTYNLPTTDFTLAHCSSHMEFTGCLDADFDP